MALVGVYILLPQFRSFHQTWSVLHAAVLPWALLAALAGVATFLAGAVIQFAAGDSKGKFSDIVLLQFAGSFVNHLLPFSLGGMGLTEEYYHKLGIRRPQALVFVTIPVIFGTITTLAILIVTSPVTLVHLSESLRSNHLTRVIVLILGICILLGILTMPLYAQRLSNVFKQAKSGLRGVRDIRQLLTILLGSVTLTLVTSSALYLSVLAVHATVSLVAAILLCISSSLVSNVAPTPDGLGATEAALVFGLTRAGLGLSQAIAGTLLYRFVTAWLPILPGLIALRRIDTKHIVR
jgi:uncharacterized membrane protein YbhN (UPF0104 family)